MIRNKNSDIYHICNLQKNYLIVCRLLYKNDVYLYIYILIVVASFLVIKKIIIAYSSSAKRLNLQPKGPYVPTRQSIWEDANHDMSNSIGIGHLLDPGSLVS